MTSLAEELHVTPRTIRNDFSVLVKQYPITAVRGNGGGVHLPDTYHPYKDSLSIEQTKTLVGLLKRTNEDEKRILKQLITEFSPDEVDETWMIEKGEELHG